MNIKWCVIYWHIGIRIAMVGRRRIAQVFQAGGRQGNEKGAGRRTRANERITPLPAMQMN